MAVLQLQEVGSTATIKNANWEIILTDPSLSKHSFGMPISENYIMTDIISPLGQKSILYNTIPKEAGSTLRIGLNFEDIDEVNIKNITIKAENYFFSNWQIYLKDNRTDETVKISNETDVIVEPPVQLSKLTQIGFSGSRLKKGENYFELHLSRINN